MRRDGTLGAAIKEIGACGLATRRPPHHLSGLVGALISQQLSVKASAAIFARFATLLPDQTLTTVDAVAAIDDRTLRSTGLSGLKLGYLRDLCAHIATGRLRLDELGALSDEQVIERLTAVKGFGRWTAEMFLIFRLQRPDVLPVGDLGIITAVQKLYRLRKRPDSKRLLQIGETWRPYRSVACWYLWQTRSRELSNARQLPLTV